MNSINCMIQRMKHSCVNAAPACHRKKTQNLTLLIPLESVIYFTEFVFALIFSDVTAR